MMKPIEIVGCVMVAVMVLNMISLLYYTWLRPYVLKKSKLTSLQLSILNFVSIFTGFMFFGGCFVIFITSPGSQNLDFTEGVCFLLPTIGMFLFSHYTYMKGIKRANLVELKKRKVRY